ncbi:hypothetical protein A1O7_02224 [Cladophialophora yegresii CBS 114405]|uniref:Uncharacterized protein n=1 Tax=Cladophialophora yegresii CBS 114405 TaxID=1182544 RepID=W9WU01_9EURO|nr:uncharacterized protein A1O7_02224 [Cladophialophora yegresii CBS 114405]EXJ61794.1 hypothetical protein A1O7_02224 [Cladophialophora yegresii CBS 114405]
MADQQLGPSKKEKEFPELRLRFWGGKNSVMGGLLAEAFMSPRRYHNLVADHKKARDARKAATAAVVATTSMKADEAVGEELSKAPTSADEKAEGTPNLEKAGRGLVRQKLDLPTPRAGNPAPHRITASSRVQHMIASNVPRKTLKSLPGYEAEEVHVTVTHRL